MQRLRRQSEKWRTAVLIVPGCVLALGVARADWRFTPAVPVNPKAEARVGVFHHLESSGRKNIAVAGKQVAVIWEDNHSGHSAVYVAVHELGARAGFAAPQRLSAGREAYEPVIVAARVADGVDGFVAAWEQDGHVWARALLPAGASSRSPSMTLGPAVEVDAHTSGQVSLAARSEGKAGRIQAVWTRQGKRFRRVMTASLQRMKAQPAALRVHGTEPVDAQPPKDQQLYPSVVLTDKATVAVWEDRRDGHTRLLYARAGEEGVFRTPRGLNEFIVGNVKLGRGTGVARVTLARAGRQGVAAAWMDKRHFLSGYDIYAGFSTDGGRHFGKNEKVQDSFGDNTPQWHPAIAVCPSGQVVVAWDDRRDGTPDVWLSWKAQWQSDPAHGVGWSDDESVAPAAGPGAQSDPVIACDADNRLHLAWIGRNRVDGHTQIWYSEGRFTP